MSNVNKENKSASSVNSNIRFNDVSVHGNYFKFSFSFANGYYECLYKNDFKGIASEKFIIDNKEYRIGIKNSQKLAKFSEAEIEEILSRRLKVLKQLRGDSESSLEKLSFELSEIKAKLEAAKSKVEKLESLLKEKEDEIKNFENETEENKIDAKKLLAESKKSRIEALEKELEALKS